MSQNRAAVQASMIKQILRTVAVASAMVGSALAGGKILEPKLDAVITTELQKPGALGDVLRAFHACVVREALTGLKEGVIGVFAPGAACFRTSNALMAQCMKVQHNEQACAGVVLSTSGHAVNHADDFR
jgi:hypothetical protein